MTSIAETPLNRLENENRLLNSNLKEGGSMPGSFLYRGELAIRFSEQRDSNGLIPTLKADQVVLAAMEGQKELTFYSCRLMTFASLKPMAELLGDMLGKDGKYFAFCSDVQHPAKYRVKMGEATFYILPIDENASFGELLVLLEIDRETIKKRGLGGKLEAVTTTVAQFNPRYEEITYERGLEVTASA